MQSKTTDVRLSTQDPLIRSLRSLLKDRTKPHAKVKSADLSCVSCPLVGLETHVAKQVLSSECSSGLMIQKNCKSYPQKVCKKVNCLYGFNTLPFFYNVKKINLILYGI